METLVIVRTLVTVAKLVIVTTLATVRTLVKVPTLPNTSYSHNNCPVSELFTVTILVTVTHNRYIQIIRHSNNTTVVSVKKTIVKVAALVKVRTLVTITTLATVATVTTPVRVKVSNQEGQ